MFPRNRTRFLPRVAILICVLLLVSGCAQLRRLTAAKSEPPPPAEEPVAEALAFYQQLEYDAAQAAFARGNYRQAVAMFEPVAKTSKDPALARMAQFGWASSLLASARTPEQARIAMGVFKAWSDMLPEQLTGEDPRMLAPAVDHLPQALEWSRELAAEKKRRLETERTLETVRRELKSRTALAAKLNKQLEELEALYQSLENKKRELIP